MGELLPLHGGMCLQVQREHVFIDELQVRRMRSQGCLVDTKSRKDA